MELAHKGGGVQAQRWKAYRIAFRDFALKAGVVQRLVGRQDVRLEAIETALVEMEKARVGYNAARDKLAQELLDSSGDADVARFRAALSTIDPPQVKELARLIWELTGKPSGTADDNWRRAEEILRRSLAA